MARRIAIVLSVLLLASATSKADQIQSFRSVAGALVVAVESTRITDLVFLGAGFDAGLRQGMVFSITRSGSRIAEVILVALSPRASAALIIQLQPGQTIRAGDTATVKTLRV